MVVIQLSTAVGADAIRKHFEKMLIYFFYQKI
jgi:hypothetical protein